MSRPKNRPTGESVISRNHTNTPVNFLELGVPEEIVSTLKNLGIETPFPIQIETLPDSIAGRDVCGKAPTGSGKTLAFGLAILSRLYRDSQNLPKAKRLPKALVLVPTRELALQIENVIAPLATSVGLKVCSIYGGVGYAKQTAALKEGIDIVVACPGRLTDLLQQEIAVLSAVSIVVVDEADRMADMGFLPTVRRLIDKTTERRQMLLFSATLDGPVDKLIRDYQNDPIRHDVKLPEEEKAEVDHHFWSVEGSDRVAVASKAIASIGSAVVFCRTKRGADRLTDRLRRSGIKSAAIHGDRSQSQRERALGEFQAGKIDALVATDIAARGIHVDAVPLVIHFDPPTDATDYVHRSGRTGRAGVNGTVISLITPDQVASTAQLQRTLSLPKGLTPPTFQRTNGDASVSRSKKYVPNSKVSIPTVVVTIPEKV
ncbi:MAG: DEAD/DEAH box helicase [Actinomycetota bacterium]|nr:DEAD/DEAH box helicase [Actinomycetota bacterium]